MARLLLLGLLLLDLMAGLTVARPTPEASKVIALQLDGAAEANSPSSSANGAGSESSLAGAPESGLQHAKHQHRPFDKSIAGAEVILGGIATAIFAAIYAYIRVTRKRSSENKV